MKDEKLYLIHILESIQKIEQYTRDGKEAFLKSSQVQDAVIRNFEIIGEAVKQISEKTRSNYREVPWRRVAGFRDVLIHDYMGVDVSEVWSIVVQELPELKKKIETIMKKFGV